VIKNFIVIVLGKFYKYEFLWAKFEIRGQFEILKFLRGQSIIFAKFEGANLQFFGNLLVQIEKL